MSQDSTDEKEPITDKSDMNHPERKAGRQALSAYLHQAIEDWATSQGGVHYSDVAVVCANLTGAIAAQGGVHPDPLKEMLDHAFHSASIKVAEAAMVKEFDKQLGELPALPTGVIKQ